MARATIYVSNISLCAAGGRVGTGCITHDVFQQLLKVAGRVHPLLKLALIVAEGTGRRLSAWRNLRWDDVDFPKGTIRWRAANDKKGYEQVVPVSDAVT